MKKMNIFCFGFGQVAKTFVKKIISENIEVKLNVTSREESKKKKFENLNYQSFQFNENNFDQSLIEELEKSDHILISIAPISGVDIVIKNLSSYIKKDKYKWITYLSATSVYGDHNGEWVDEESKTEPTSLNGIERLNAEKSWLSQADKEELPVQIFRLSGIYSNQNNILFRLKSGKVKIIKKKNHFFSRIHLEDIADILFKSLTNFRSKEIYNISDDRPASSEEVTLYGVKLLGIDKPMVIEVDSIESEMLKNFYKDSKKVSNKKIKKTLNYEMKYPSYIEGLNNIRDHLI